MEYNAKSHKIVLYNPRSDPTLRTTEAPLSLLTIAAIPHQWGFEIKIITWDSVKDPVAKILAEGPHALCLGISAMTGYQITDGLKVAQKFKEKYPHIPIVWGGYHPSLLPLQTIAHPCVDIVVKGQGERTFSELVEAWQKGSSLADIAGLVYKKEGRFIDNPDRPSEDINNFPPFPYELLNIKKYVWSHNDLGSRTISYMSSYGCPHQCGFCCIQKITKRRWFGLSAERVLDDIESLISNYGINGIAFAEANFFVDEKRVRQICQGIVKRGLKIRWGDANGQTKQLANYSDETWRLMYASGCRSILAGAESGDQESLDFINKNMSVEDNLRFAEKCRQYNIRIIYSCLAGLPWKNLKRKEIIRRIDKEIWATIGMIDKLLPLDKRNRFLFFVYLPYPGTTLYQEALRLGFRPPDNLADWGNFNFYARHTPWIARRQERLITMLSSYVFLFINPDIDLIPEAISANKMIRLLVKLLIKVLKSICKLRWKYKYFRFSIDHWLYWFIRKRQKYI